MDQLGGSGKHADGASCGERSLCGGSTASEMAGTAFGCGGVEGRKNRQAGRVTRISGREVRQMAIAGRVCLRGSDSAHERGQVQEDRAARTVCRLEVGVLRAVDLISASGLRRGAFNYA